MKLYIVKGIEIDRKKSVSTSKRINSFIGYYSNLKEVYSQFERKTVKSYSSIANKINETNHYITYDSKFSIDEKMMKFQQIIIERVQVNKVYSKSKYINLSPLIAQELSDFRF
ncbi:hypothetical protein [Olleya marilimosa]|uniref:hypothetical protein n=1 Tax=Olleya marilimosa TaxID=272164 RepID=UPI00168D5293|nr:hypothetical protein [Olleya marilimosa]MBD3892156.1 hypothetical protein [Olleya marilimosa]